VPGPRLDRPQGRDDLHEPEVAQKVVDDLGEHHRNVDWHAELVVDRLVTPPAPVRELVEAARDP